MERIILADPGHKFARAILNRETGVAYAPLERNTSIGPVQHGSPGPPSADHLPQRMKPSDPQSIMLFLWNFCIFLWFYARNP
jgi:hypothetical protein